MMWTWETLLIIYAVTGGTIFPLVETYRRFGADERHPHGTVTLSGLLLRFLFWPLFYPIDVRHAFQKKAP